MTLFLRFLVLVVLSFSAAAADVHYQGVKPDFIIDVRTPAEFAGGHIDGAINIPVDQIASQIAAIKGLKQDSTLVVYCRSGRRSAAAAQILQQKGYGHVLDAGSFESLAKSLKPCTPATC